MSNTTTYTNFSAIDYRGRDSLSSYALSLTPLIFVPDLPQSAHERVVWDFGDGTVSKSFSASKSYELPGKYSVNLVIYDCNNNAMISTFEKIVNIYDYLPFTFNITAYDQTFDASSDIFDLSLGSPITTDRFFKCGHIGGPLVFNVSYPPYQTPSNIYYSVSGSESLNYWDIVDSKFGHLENFYTCYSPVYNYSLGTYQFREVQRIEPEISRLYAKISNNAIVSALSTELNSYFIGTSCQQWAYFKDDSISDNISMRFWFDKTNNQISLLSNPNVNYLNTLGITLSSKIIDNVPTKLSITSNGLDGEGYPITSFQITPIKYFNTKIPFVVKIKDVNDMSVKNYSPIALSSLDIKVFYINSTTLSAASGTLLDEYANEINAEGSPTILPTSQYSISSLNYTLSSQNFGGAFRGYFQFFPSVNYDLLQNVNLAISGTFINDQLSSYDLSGTSNYFNIYSQNYFDMYKMGEDFNASETLKDLRFQETLIDKTVLFEDFLGSLLGDADYDHETIGVKIYEKISNFISNTQDIDGCNQEFIDSLAHILGYNDNGEERYQYPEKIKQIINLASVSKHRLMGVGNKFKDNLDIRGRTSKEEYGINIGSKISPVTYVINAPTPIVALEKFSNTYTTLNTTQPVSALSSWSYPLSTYSSDTWGWPLVLPDVFNFSDIEKYYLFFEYVDKTDDTVTGGMVDFRNAKTTVLSSNTNAELFGDEGIFKNMFLDTMYQSLSLIT